MDHLENLNIDNVCNEITSETYFNLNSAISNQTVENIKKELSLWNFSINKNDILPSKTFNGWYHSMAIAKSKTVCDIVTSKTLLDICTKYIGPEFRLKAHRVYSTLSGAKMPWHSDDKAYQQKKNYKGLIFIIYLKDVMKGEFQIIKDSEKFSEKFKEPNVRDQIINKEYSDKIVSFKCPTGSLIIYNHKAIHRAKPYFDPFWMRTSLFIQVDNNIDDSEKVIVNPSYLNNIDDRLKMFLGFGKKSEMPHEPVVTGYHTLDIKNLIKIIFNCFVSILFLKPYYFVRRSQLLKKLFKR